jgi:hypothetical protein
MRLLKTRDAAAYLGVSPQFLHKQRVRPRDTDTARVPFLRISPKCVRYDIRDLDRYIEARKAEAEAGE